MGDAMNDDLVKRLHETLPGLQTPMMGGDCLAVLLCSHFDDGEPNPDSDNGWSESAEEGYTEIIAAIRAHYEPAAARIAELEALVSSEVSQRYRDCAALLARAEAAEAQVAAASDTFYIDCEFDGHNGPLLSIAMVRGDGWSLHVEVEGVAVADPWVLANVTPIMGAHQADISRRVRADEVGGCLREFIGDCQRPKIIADSPVDIARFCRAISTGEDGGWAPSSYPGMTFAVENVDCYPTKLSGAVQHNAWWDAMALRIALAAWEAAK